MKITFTPEEKEKARIFAAKSKIVGTVAKDATSILLKQTWSISKELYKISRKSINEQFKNI